MTEQPPRPTPASTASAQPDRSAFGGPIGGVAMMICLPLLSVYLWVCIHRFDGALVLPDLDLLAQLPAPNLSSLLYLSGWFAFQLALDLYLPGRVYLNQPQRDGRRLTYRLNGLASLCVTLLALGVLLATGLVSGASTLAQLGPLLITAIIVAYLLSLFLYVYGKRYRPEGDVRPQVGQLAVQPDGSASVVASGPVNLAHVAYDYFMGTALNPRIGRLDLKMFCESKIGMTSWIVLTLLMAHAEYQISGALSLAMLLVCLFQLVYVVDFFWFEEAMLSTWDINNENYGFMLAFGFTVWMPFNFSLQAQYLVHNTPHVPGWLAALLVLLNFAGYFVFRTSNLQKHRFRTVPGAKIWGREPSFIQTQRGTRLLTAGWWGIARHSNYFGDLLMALAWCIPCGFSHITPYFYFIYFAPLLIDRERRDDRHCARKYGGDWVRYCTAVKYRIVPFLY